MAHCVFLMPLLLLFLIPLKGHLSRNSMFFISIKLLSFSINSHRLCVSISFVNESNVAARRE